MINISVLIVLVIVCTVSANTKTIISQGDTWHYAVLPKELFSDWSNAGYTSVDWNSLTWLAGKAAFGNSYSYDSVILPIPGTQWFPGTCLALQKTVVIKGKLEYPVELNLAVDNGAMVFVNGNQIFKGNDEGYTSAWEYTDSVDNKLFVVGKNTVRVLIEDHGGLTYFDMELKGNMSRTKSVIPLVFLAMTGIVVCIGFVAKRF